MPLRREDPAGDKRWRVVGLEIIQIEPQGSPGREETLGQGQEETPENRRTRGLWHLGRPCHGRKQGLCPAQRLGPGGCSVSLDRINELMEE